jgi:hypothetical protein
MGAKKGRIPWNKGLTKSQHESLRIIGEKVSIKNKCKISHKKGKTNYELYGEEKAAEIKEKSSNSHSGIFMSDIAKEKLRQNSHFFILNKEHKGKTYNELHGEEKAKELLNKLSRPYEEKMDVKIAIEVKRKARERKLKEIKTNGFWMTLGKNEAQLLDEQEIKDNCKIERQFRVPTLNYVVDGYENYHRTQIQKDFQRQNEIKEYLKCKFVIIEDK